jgi:predicted flap endonuclease-1-like 5' DNA nuclease
MINFTPFTGSKKEGGPMDVSFWLSFSPMAPFFGVEYRFADMFKFDQAFAPKFDVFAPKPVEKKAEAKPAAKPKKAAAPKAKKVEEPKVEEPKVEAAAPVEAEPVIETPAPVEAPVEVKVEEVVVETLAADRPATLFDAPPANVDDLKLIKGVGPKLEGMLNGLGIYTFEQIAGFSLSELQWVDENLTSFKGRAFRDDWIAQAKALLG